MEGRTRVLDGLCLVRMTGLLAYNVIGWFEIRVDDLKLVGLCWKKHQQFAD